MNSAEALLALSSGDPSTQMGAVNYTRTDGKSAAEVWSAVLALFSSDVPESLRGVFPWWFLQTLTNPDRG